MKIIEIGIASYLEDSHTGADAIRLVVVDFDEVSARILPLPADLWVDTPADLVDDLGTLAPLNQIYLTAYQTASGNPDQVRTQKATQVLAQTIVDEFGFVPDKYININGDAFITLVDDLGGITISLDTAIDASNENFGLFPVGQQTLDGQRTLDFVRILYPNGVGPDYIGRFERQNKAIYALFAAVLDKWNLALDLAKDARKMVVTDLSVDQANDLVCMIEEVGSEEVIIYVDSSIMHLDSQGRMIPEAGEINELISELEGN